MRIPDGYQGPALEIILRTSKPADNTAEVLQQLLSHV